MKRYIYICDEFYIGAQLKIMWVTERFSLDELIAFFTIFQIFRFLCNPSGLFARETCKFFVMYIIYKNP